MSKTVKKIIYSTISLFFIVTFSSSCATNPADLSKYPIDDMQYIITSTKNKTELYASVREALVDLLENKKDIDFEDKDMGVISYKYKESFNIAVSPASLDYWVKIEIKDNKMRVTVNNIHGLFFNSGSGEWEESSLGIKYIDAYRKDYFNIYQAQMTVVKDILNKAANDNADWQ
jgi:hypothetical protein